MKIGILGGGQLARMIALAGYPLGLDFIILDPSFDAGAVKLGEHLQGAYNDQNLLAQLAEKADIVTYEFENIPAKVAEFLASQTQVYPAPNALAIAQDRLTEKDFFHQLDIPTARYAAIDSLNDLQAAMTTIGYPALLKSRRMGYDGKGQVIIEKPEALTTAWERMQGCQAIIESWVPFQREVSMIAARNLAGSVVFYPLSENKHEKGILRVAECRMADKLQNQAETYVTRLLNKLDYVGIIALELFDVDGQLLANEFAPRVHNSGHWTIEGTETCQFENHLRAILNLPLGSTEARGYTGMVNFIGGIPETRAVMSIANAHYHLYAKSPRKGRKVAHATVLAKTPESCQDALGRLQVLAQKVDHS